MENINNLEAAENNAESLKRKRDQENLVQAEPTPDPEPTEPTFLNDSELSSFHSFLLHAILSSHPAFQRPKTVSKSNIQKLPSFIFDKSATTQLSANTSTTCNICLLDYKDGDKCRELNCKHGFHQECVDEWLGSGSNSCPLCREKVCNEPDSRSSQISGVFVFSFVRRSATEVAENTQGNDD